MLFRSILLKYSGIDAGIVENNAIHEVLKLHSIRSEIYENMKILQNAGLLRD